MNPEDVPEGPLLLDTDVASFLRTGRNAEPFKPLVAGHLLCLSFATVGELWFGAEHARWGEQRRAGLEAFMHQFVVIPVDNVTALRWSQIHAAVRDQVGVNDEWVAACALGRNPTLPIVSNNVRHFAPIADRFPDLTIVHPDL